MSSPKGFGGVSGHLDHAVFLIAGEEEPRFFKGLPHGGNPGGQGCLR